MITGAEAVIRALGEEGVDTVFGLPGGAVLPLYDALTGSDLRHILVRHEQAAAHAADGYARSTGRVGVCIATSGPGATNLVTGLATAHMDSVPIVAITGNVPTALLGTDAFQEADIYGATQSVTKHNYLVRDVSSLPGVMRHAFHIARTGRPGPVLIDIPKDVFQDRLEFSYPGHVDLPGYRVAGEPDNCTVRAAAGAIVESARPVLHVGGGARGASGVLRALAERTGIPVTTTLMGLGVFPSGHPLHAGMPGMHGTYAANMALAGTDCLIAVGCRFDDRVTGDVEEFAGRAVIIHIDIDAAEIGKIKPARFALPCDAGSGLQALLDALNERMAGRRPGIEFRDWVLEVDRWKREHPIRYHDGEDDLAPQRVIEAIHAHAHGEARVVTGVGQHQMWTALLYPFSQPRQLVTSGGLGTMGFGLPAAMGVQVACPGEQVICIDGDGSFQMNSQELATVAQYQLPIKVFIINNGAYGMVRQWQEMFYDGRLSSSVLVPVPDFVELARAYGICGARVELPGDLPSVVGEALASRGPVVVDCVVRKGERLLPMVPPGAALDRIIEA